MFWILTKLPVISISPAFFLSLKCVLIHEVAVIYMLLNIEKASAAKEGSRGSPPGKIKNLRKGVL